MLLTRDSILNAQDLKTIEVEVPEWGATARLQEMTGILRDRFEQRFFKVKGKDVVQNFEFYRIILVVYCLVDDNGVRIFSDSDDDIKALGSKSSSVIERLAQAAQSINGIGPKEVEEATKN